MCVAGIVEQRPDLQPSEGNFMSTDETTWTITVPQAGKRYFSLSRGASYAAAERGDIPTIKVGRLLRVPIKAIERLLEEPFKKGREVRSHD